MTKCQKKVVIVYINLTGIEHKLGLETLTPKTPNFMLMNPNFICKIRGSYLLILV